MFFTSDNRIFGDFIKRFNFQALEEFFLILAGNFMVNKILSSSKKQKATIIDSCFNFINHMVNHMRRLANFCIDCRYRILKVLCRYQ